MNLRQIARLAGLSPSAVSLALRGSAKVSPATRERVRQLADSVGYKPDAAVAAMMSHLRQPPEVRQRACFALISFYDDASPWRRSRHLTRIYEGMVRRAGELGYRLEPLWLRAPGMTYERAQGILNARGIEGLLSFGSPNLEEEFPPELSRYAVVTVGLSIRTPLHRVTSSFYNDMVQVLERVHRLGYRRPGLVVGNYEDARSGRAFASAYLGWCDHRLGSGSARAVLRLDRVDPEALRPWLWREKPDVIVFAHLPEALPELRAALRQCRARVPERIGVAALSQLVDDTEFSGLQQNQLLMGGWAVELLAARIANRDFGIPANPRLEMVEGQWIEGRSLRAPS